MPYPEDLNDETTRAMPAKVLQPLDYAKPPRRNRWFTPWMLSTLMGNPFVWLLFNLVFVVAVVAVLMIVKWLK